MTEETLFELARKTPEAERPALLDRACEGNPELRKRVEALLRADAGSSPLSKPSPIQEATTGFQKTVSYQSESFAGTIIATRYKLLEKLGEGGMGSVWMADQTEPVKRRVAVKLIRTERSSSKTILARFEAERQAIALMDHPNIAKLLDAGTTENGSPFFVMELVKGIPLTEFCDIHKLSIPDRLSLFMQICSAVQHAHQKGIIHRDLKPTNILVELHDDKPVPKVIDFGLAKATSGMQLTENTLFTGFGTVAGTPLYMAPEQASFNAVDIDTRADIYSLGVILYELLTGTTPISREKLKQAALDEMMKLIREQEAPTPSSRLSSAETKPTVAANRHTEPHKLGRYIKGELDWIVMKALSKERARRYETANGFARDVERFLNHETILAGPVSTAYRLRKFVDRNRGKVIAAGLMVGALLLGIIGTTLGLFEAKRQEAVASERAEGERLAKLDAEAQKEQAQKRLRQIEKSNEILGSIFVNLDPKEIAKNEKPLQEILVKKLDNAVAQLNGDVIGDPIVIAALQNRLGVSLINLGEPTKALSLLQQSMELRRKHLGFNHSDTLVSMNDLAVGYMRAGKIELALPLSQEALRFTKEKFGIDSIESLRIMNNLGINYQHAGRLDLAVSLLEEAHQLVKKYHDPKQELPLAILHNIGTAYVELGKPELAIPILEQVVQVEKSMNRADDPSTLISQSALGGAYSAVGRLPESIELLERTRDTQIKLLGSDNPETVSTLNHLAGAYGEIGRFTDAAQLAEMVLTTRRLKLGGDNPQTIVAINNLAAAWWEAGRLDKSVPMFEEALRKQEAKLGRHHQDTQWTVANLGVNYKDAGRVSEALPYLEEAYRASRKNFALLWITPQLMDAYLKAGKKREALDLAKGEILMARASLPADNLDRAMILAGAGLTLLKGAEFQQAEAVLREALTIYERQTPNQYRTFSVRSVLGGALLGQKKYAEAEPLLLSSYKELKPCVNLIPQPNQYRVTEALDRLIQFYTETNKPDEVKKWQAEREKYPKLPEKK